ncbi:MAG: phosphoglycolate phosphatase [Crenarchaeota archaeon]|nr:phosphoglycolate phosphatase [Thermoproteota archaeon]
MIATDVDGTLTIRRGELLLSLEAIRAIRELEENGIIVSLVSGNSLPITAGLARYIGAKGPVIAENGCVIFYKGETIHLCKGRPPEQLLDELREAGFKESWQNIYRHHDIAFYPPPEFNKQVLQRIVEKYGMRIYDSGYAIHIQPPGGGKGEGLKTAAELVGINVESVLSVGDGLNDIPLFQTAGFSACPADADPKVKQIVNYVAKRPGGQGFAEIAELVLNGYF